MREPTLTVVTYNLNYGLAGDAATLDAIAERDADIVFLQETNAAWRAAIEAKLGKRYPGRVWLDGEAAGGMAVLSKQRLTGEKLDGFLDALQWLEHQGFRTALPEFQPGAKTWHWRVGSMNLTGQLDHVAYGDAFGPIDAHVERDGHSDHWPVTVAFVRAKPGALRPPAPSGASISLY